MAKDIGRQIIEIIATDRIDKPISSMSGKLKRAKPKLAKEVELGIGETYEDERVHARVEQQDVMKARRMAEAVAEFAEQYPRHGKILQNLIAEQRTLSETHLYFNMNPGCRITAEDYLQVMENLGFTPATSRTLYPELMDISHKMARKRDETERSILIG